MHAVCLLQWFQVQQEKHIWPTCPLFRADPPASMLLRIEVPPTPPPTPFRWEAARQHMEFVNYAWDETIPIERDSFFIQFFQQRLPNNIMLYQTVSGLYLATFHRYENRGVSRFLAQTKREAIRRFRFELENLLCSL